MGILGDCVSILALIVKLLLLPALSTTVVVIVKGPSCKPAKVAAKVPTLMDAVTSLTTTEFIPEAASKTVPSTTIVVLFIHSPSSWEVIEIIGGVVSISVIVRSGVIRSPSESSLPEASIKVTST